MSSSHSLTFNSTSQDLQLVSSKHEYGSYLAVLCFVKVGSRHSVSRPSSRRLIVFHVSKMFSTETLISWSQNNDETAETQSIVSRTRDLCVVNRLSLFIAGIIFINVFHRTCINKNRNNSTQKVIHALFHSGGPHWWRCIILIYQISLS
jgi:hypothetical protein